MDVKELIKELLSLKQVDKFHIEYWDKTNDGEEDSDECCVKVSMDKEFF